MVRKTTSLIMRQLKQQSEPSNSWRALPMAQGWKHTVQLNPPGMVLGGRRVAEGGGGWRLVARRDYDPAPHSPLEEHGANIANMPKEDRQPRIGALPPNPTKTKGPLATNNHATRAEGARRHPIPSVPIART